MIKDYFLRNYRNEKIRYKSKQNNDNNIFNNCIYIYWIACHMGTLKTDENIQRINPINHLYCNRLGLNISIWILKQITIHEYFSKTHTNKDDIKNEE